MIGRNKSVSMNITVDAYFLNQNYLLPRFPDVYPRVPTHCQGPSSTPAFSLAATFKISSHISPLWLEMALVTLLLASGPAGKQMRGWYALKYTMSFIFS